MDATALAATVLAVVVTTVGMILLLLRRGGAQTAPPAEPAPEPKPQPSSSKAKQPAAGKPPKAPAKPSAPAKDHPWLHTELKGHTDDVLQIRFSSDTKTLASVSDDRTVRLWSVATFGEKSPTYMRVNVELDYARAIEFTQDSRAFIVLLGNAQKIRVFGVGKREAKPVLDVPDKERVVSTAEVVGIGIASSERHKYMATCFSDTTIAIWSIKGERVGTIDTKMMNNASLAISPCGTFIACTGFTPETRIWAVTSAGGHFQQASPAMTLKGHTSGVYAAVFSIDSTMVATVSKDGTWRLFNIDVKYELQQECNLLASGPYKEEPGCTPCIALSPDGLTVAVGCGSHIEFFGSGDGALLGTVEGAHAGAVRSMQFDAESRVLASCGKDRIVRVWHNIPGMNVLIRNLERKFNITENSTAKDRIKGQLEKARKTRDAVLAKKN